MMRLRPVFVSAILSFMLAACATVSTSGDYVLSNGQTLRGNLIITSGDAVLEEASRVTGSVLMTSGDLDVLGQIDGDILMTSGDIRLGPDSVVRGDIIATSGDVSRADGAEVYGQIRPNQTTFRIGRGLVGSLLWLCCILPLLLIIGVIALKMVYSRRKTNVAPAAPIVSDDTSQRLQQLKQMLDNELITEVEYEAKKADILAEL